MYLMLEEENVVEVMLAKRDNPGEVGAGDVVIDDLAARLMLRYIFLFRESLFFFWPLA